MSSIKDEALRLLAAGLSVIPIRADGSKAPALKAWKPEQKRPMSAATAAELFTGKVGLAVISGAVSGNLECLDFEAMAVFSRWCERVPALLRDQLVMVATAGGGMHLRYRCEEPIPAGRKLARAADCELLIETRGEGHYALVPPSPGACHPSGNCYELVQGDLAALPRLTADQREILIQAALALNEYVDTPARVESPLKRSAPLWEDDLPPGEDYNRRGDWPALLTRHGWRLDKCVGETQHWTRAGKDDGTSATLGHVAPGIFVVFSTNAAPFEAEKGYDLFGAYARLEHGGDFAAAGRALRVEGYGSAPAETVTIKVGSKRVNSDGEEDEEDGEEADDTEIKAPSEDKLATEWAESVTGRFLFAEGDEWIEYGGECWQPVSDSTTDTQIRAWLKSRGRGKRVGVRVKRIREMRTLASLMLGEQGRPLPKSRFNGNRRLLPLANGVLDVETRQLAAHGPHHLNTYCLPYAYDPQADCPRFRQFLREVMLQEDGTPCVEWIDTLIHFMGYCLIPDCHAETVLINVGEGGNGKSVWAKVLEALVGDVNCASIDPRQLELKPDYTLASLYGKLVGFLNEPTKQQISGCSGYLKALVSGDAVQARQPHRQAFTYRPYMRFVVSCNDLPETKDLSGGWYRRLLMIEWRFRPETPDRRLDRKLIAELPGILNLALDGLDWLREREYEFEEPEESRKLKKEYRHGQDSAAQFLDTPHCQADRNNRELWCYPAPLHKRYAEWCKEAGYPPMNVDAFGKHLTKRLGYPAAAPEKLEGRSIRVRRGIRLLASMEVSAGAGTPIQGQIVQ